MCRDPFLSCLEDFGYCVVRLPAADLDPLQLLLRRGDDLERLGRLSTALVPGPHVALPHVTRGQPAASLEEVRLVAPSALRHRILPSYNATGEGIAVDAIVRHLLESND